MKLQSVSLIILMKALFGIVCAGLIIFLLLKICSISFLYDYRVLIFLCSFCVFLFIVYQGSVEFKESDGESGCVVYLDYYDVFKCLSIFLVPLVVMYFGSGGNGDNHGIKIFCVIYMAVMLIHITYISAQFNSLKILPIVILVKLVMSIIWVYGLKQLLDPSGKNADERRKSRGYAVILLMIITPIINALVLNDEGKHLIQSKFKGRRFAGAKSLRKMMD